MIPGAFEYHRPDTVDDVIKLMSKYGDDGRVIAGGHSLLPMMKLRLATPEHLIDLGRVEDLGGISQDGGTITIGAMATQHEALASDCLSKYCPIIQEAAMVIADPQVRYFGTIGGNVANGDPGNDLPAVMQCLEIHKNHCPSGGTIDVFVEPILPRPSLVIAGASPVAKALCELGRRSDLAVTVAALPEDQPGFAEADFRIEGFDLSEASPAQIHFVVVATQGKRDREALSAALASKAPYVAFVGSRRKAEALKEKLLEDGVPADSFEKLHAPAGLDIGAATPEEIAVSILAEIVRERRGEARLAPDAAVQIEKIDGGSSESQVVSPALGGCQGKEGRH